MGFGLVFPFVYCYVYKEVQRDICQVKVTFNFIVSFAICTEHVKIFNFISLRHTVST